MLIIISLIIYFIYFLNSDVPILISFRKMKESGQLSRLEKKWESVFQPDCDLSEEVYPLAMRDVFVAFIMLLMALVMSLLLLQLEFLLRDPLVTSPGSEDYYSNKRVGPISHAGGTLTHRKITV